MGDGGGDRQLNVFGAPLEVCCKKPMTGFYRDGYCNTGPMDTGTHTVCAHMPLCSPLARSRNGGLRSEALVAQNQYENLANCFFGNTKNTCLGRCVTLFQLLSAVSRALLEKCLCDRAWLLCVM